MISAAEGKSGPITSSQSSANGVFGSSNRRIQALTTSLRLCAGISVAIPTAIPSVPLRRRFGNAAGITDGDLITLQEVDEADYNTTAEAYITTFSARTQPALDLLQINDGDTTNDVAEPVDIELVLIFTDVDTNETESATALTQLSRSLSLPGDTDPDTIPTHKWQLSADGNYIEYLIDGAVIGKVPLITT